MHRADLPVTGRLRSRRKQVRNETRKKITQPRAVKSLAVVSIHPPRVIAITRMTPAEYIIFSKLLSSLSPPLAVLPQVLILERIPCGKLQILAGLSYRHPTR